MSRQQRAFIDEFGNTGLDFSKPGVSTHFIVTAAIFDAESTEGLETSLEEVRVRHFQSGEMKSSKVGSDDDRRLRVLRDLMLLPFHVYSCVADKREIQSRGLTYKGSFLKYFHAQVDAVLFRTFPDLQIFSDEHGSSDFMAGFVKYVRSQHIPDLFEQASFGFLASKESVIIQLADFIGGTIARAHDKTVFSERGGEMMALLAPKVVGLDLWPAVSSSYLSEGPRHASYLDSTISDLGVSLADQFVAANAGSAVPAIVDQVRLCRLLLFHAQNVARYRYVKTSEILNNLNYGRGGALSDHYLRTKVVARLRDAGVLIASSPRGYKLPSCASDLNDFVNHCSSMIHPMLARIGRCRNQIRLATKNGLDILEPEEFGYLKRFLNSGASPQ